MSRGERLDPKRGGEGPEAISLPPEAVLGRGVTAWQLEPPQKEEVKEVWSSLSIAPSVAASDNIAAVPSDKSDGDNPSDLGFTNEWTTPEKNPDEKNRVTDEPFVPITGFEDPTPVPTPEEIDREVRRATVIINVTLARNETPRRRRRPNP